MGNSESSGAIDASYGNAELAKLTTPVAAIDTRFCNSAPGGESDYVTRLLDGEKKTPIVVLKRLAHNTQAVRAAASSDDVAGEKLFDVHFKLGESNTLWFEDTELFVDFADVRTGERCQIVLDGDWCQHSVVFWLVRDSDTPIAAAVTKEPITRVTPKSSSKFNTKYVLEIAANVDAALLVLLEDKLRIDRLEFNQRLLSPLDPTERRHANRKSVL